MKFIHVILFCFFVVQMAQAQQKIEIYNPNADAAADITKATALAGKEGKHVFLQVGGNWCPWCIRFHKFVNEDAQLDSILTANFEVVKVNYSRENENRKVLASLGYPQRFGFPVFVILDGNGKVIHIQDSSLLEEGKGYSAEKVKNMFLMWSAESLRLASEKYKP
ncbi:MAG: thioredoxin family protein [Bacteroidetes bacterium]|nr:thioredoxin family protein [Bacteroidota bacterium]